MILTVLLLLCAVNLHYAQEGDTCIKDGVPGVCADLKQCPDALRDIQNKKRPQHCVFGTRNAIVCCVSPVTTTTTTTIIERPQKCVLPPYPEHGSYTANVARVSPGEVHDSFVLNVTCDPGYSMDGPQLLFCRDGWWPEKMTNCISQSCTKGGITGVCIKLNQCTAAREDIKNRIAPQHCWFGGVDPIVCCVPFYSSGPIPSTTERNQVSSQGVAFGKIIDEEAYETCINRVGEAGECVPYYLCQLQDKSDQLDTHGPVETCGGYLDVCCTPAERLHPIKGVVYL